MKFLHFVCLLIVSFYGPNIIAGSTCNCPVEHPQTRFCQDHFVFLVEIGLGEPTPLPGEPDIGFNQNINFKYNVTVLEIYKDQDVSPVEEGDTIELWSPMGFCGRTNLEYLEVYVVGGKHVTHSNPTATEEYNLLQIGKCHSMIKFDDLTDQQITGLEGLFEGLCKTCPIRGIFSILSLPEGGKIYEHAKSQMWSPYHECFFNPAASVQHQVDDCESKFSFCKPDQSGTCAWDLNADYEKCFIERETTYQYKQMGSAAAAVTKPSDCKKLQYKRLKRKCIRQFKKLRQSRAKMNG